MLWNGNRNRKTLLEISKRQRCAGREYYQGKRVGKWSSSGITYIRQKKGKIKYYLGQYLCSALQLLGGVGHRIGQWLHPALSLLPLRSQLGQSIWRREGLRPPRPAAPASPFHASFRWQSLTLSSSLAPLITRTVRIQTILTFYIAKFLDITRSNIVVLFIQLFKRFKNTS